ncbi:MAG: AAA family ATPase, partial [Anaerolineae bacterium]
MSRKQARALIYVLAMTLQPVPRDRLVFLFWPDKPEVTARRNLSRVASYIRNELPHPELLRINQESIGLNPEMVWSDAARFMELAEQSSPAQREEMATLYDGSFLSGFSLPGNSEFDFWLTSQQQQYEGRYLTALKGLIQIKFAVQDLSRAIHYAQRYLAIDELAEDVHQQLIRLYAASGDRSAALRQFEACTLILERELGVEPLPETWAAYEAARSPAVKPAPQVKTQPTWTVLPSLELPLVGRQKAWQALEASYRRFQRGGLIFIRGEPGIGKSRLLQEFATSQDRLVLSGNSHASTQRLPYQPLTEALRQALSQFQLWTGIRPIWLSEASRILPELGEHFPDLPQAIAVKPEQAQAHLYEALSQCMLGIAANAPTLLCLDDLQWADEATLGWLSHLSGRLAGSGVCILGAYRTAGASAMAGLRESLKRMDLLAEVTLSGLSLEAIVSILESLPAPPPQPRSLAARIKDATGGNPFFLLETIRAVLESGQMASPPETLPVAESVQEAILGRLAKLSPVARQVLEAAAVLAPDLDQPLLQETAGRAEFEVA